MSTSKRSVYFDVKTTRERSNTIRDSWLTNVQQMPEFVSKNVFYDNKNRNILQKDEKWGVLEIAPHEWGVEYIFSFTMGVTAGIMANAIYDVLKSHLPMFLKNLKITFPENHKTIKIDIQIDSSYGGIDIVTIENGEIKLAIKEPSQSSKDKLVWLLAVSDGAMPRSDLRKNMHIRLAELESILNELEHEEKILRRELHESNSGRSTQLIKLIIRP